MRTTWVLRTLFVALPVAAGAPCGCGGNTDSGTGGLAGAGGSGETTGVALADLDRARAVAFCEWAARCPLALEASAWVPFVFSFDRCVYEFERHMANEARPMPGWVIGEAVNRGTLTYDSDAARACIDTVAALTCLEVPFYGDFTAWPTDVACIGVLQGNLPLGEPCHFDDECEGGWCQSDDACPGTCSPDLGPDSDCMSKSNERACAPGLQCSWGTGTCVSADPPTSAPGAGTACSYGPSGPAAICDYGLFCDGTDGCQPMTPVGEGGQFVVNHGMCQQGLFPVTVYESTYECRQLTEVGEGASCAGNVLCAITADLVLVCSSPDEICVEPTPTQTLPAGSPCSYDHDCESGACQNNYTTLPHTCVARSDACYPF